MITWVFIANLHNCFFFLTFYVIFLRWCYKISWLSVRRVNLKYPQTRGRNTWIQENLKTPSKVWFSPLFKRWVWRGWSTEFNSALSYEDCMVYFFTYLFVFYTVLEKISLIRRRPAVWWESQDIRRLLAFLPKYGRRGSRHQLDINERPRWLSKWSSLPHRPSQISLQLHVSAIT